VDAGDKRDVRRLIAQALSAGRSIVMNTEIEDTEVENTDLGDNTPGDESPPSPFST